MKIDFFISSLSSGGAEHVLVNLAKYFSGKGEDVSITSFEKRPQFYEVHENISLNKVNHSHKNGLLAFMSDLKATRNLLKSRKPDVAVSFLSRCNLMLILASFFLKNKVVVCDRNNLCLKYPKYIFVLTCWLYRFADKICVQTNEVKAYYPKYLQKKMCVLENPLNFEELENQCTENDIHKDNVVLSVSRLEKQKDFSTLIKAFDKIADKRKDWILKIYGQGNQKDSLQNLIDSLKLENRVFLCGVTHAPYKEMKKAKIFVLSSFYEGFPNVLCEAMHAELPCISTNCQCGPSELIQDGVNGFLVPVGDIDKMADKIDLLMQNPQLCTETGLHAKESTDRLESSIISEKWLDMLSDIVKDGKKNG